MFRIARRTRFRYIYRNLSAPASSTTAPLDQTHPNAPLNLDPTLQSLLKDVDMSLVRHKARHLPRIHCELEAIPTDQSVDDGVAYDEEYQDNSFERKDTRRSPAAHFGSRHIGAVVLPFELQKSINRLIADSDGPQLHNDAKRLFFGSGESGANPLSWGANFDVKYKSRRQAMYKSERDGTAFASVALPAQYSAIYSVLDHVKHRLESDWNVERVIDWGAGAGSGLWASLYAFRKSPDAEDTTAEERQVRQSMISTYLGIDKRDGLVSIGKRLLQDVSLGSLNLSWQRAFHDEDKIPHVEAHNTLALSAFMLSSLPNGQARKSLIKEIWDSGAHVIILIDHNTTSGFECIAEAREYLLKVGRKELEDPEKNHWPTRGSHAVAPCPHDAPCPLFHPGSTRLVCGFSQRIQRPEFVRRTKHSRIGHEDIGYSYVVIRRGPRPVASTTKSGRIGDIGQLALEKETLQVPLKELRLHSDYEKAPMCKTEQAVSEPNNIPRQSTEFQSEETLKEALRLEAFSWPRLIFPPLKRSGHIIIDSCTPEGKIMRLTIPKSQGKQPYYDARKSSWGDMFPHEPRNPPQIRHQPTRAKRKGGTSPTEGHDIGKRGSTGKKSDMAGYLKLSKDLKERENKMRRDRLRSSRQ